MAKKKHTYARAKRQKRAQRALTTAARREAQAEAAPAEEAKPVAKKATRKKAKTEE